jgi:hypothetical protein
MRAAVARLRGNGDGCPLPDCPTPRVQSECDDDADGDADAAPGGRELPDAGGRPDAADPAVPVGSAGGLFANAG